MSDEAIETLRARVRQGDEAARPALQRALVRAGRRVDEAWTDLPGPVVLGDGLERPLSSQASAALAHDLSVLDPRAVVAAVAVDAPAASRRVALAVYEGGRGPWLVASSRHTEGGADGVVLDLLDGCPSGARDLTERRGLWDGTWARREASLPRPIATRRLLDVARSLFARLGDPLPDDLASATEHGDGPLGEAEVRRTWVDRARRVVVHERTRNDGPLTPEPDDRSCDALVRGLPGGAVLILVGDEGHALRRQALEAPRALLEQVDAAWRAALAEAR